MRLQALKARPRRRRLPPDLGESTLDNRLQKPHGVRGAGGTSLGGCQPNRVQATLPAVSRRIIFVSCPLVSKVHCLTDQRPSLVSTGSSCSSNELSSTFRLRSSYLMRMMLRPLRKALSGRIVLIFKTGASVCDLAGMDNVHRITPRFWLGHTQ
jgi:hypothetical protein